MNENNEVEWICDECGGVVGGKDKFCRHCGPELVDDVNNMDSGESDTAEPETGADLIDRVEEIRQL